MKIKIKSSKIIFKGKLIELHVSKVLFPNNYLSSTEKIIHKGAAAIIPILDAKHIILIRQFRPAIGKFIYEIPAGTLGKNENPIKCAKRELIEETGYSAKKITKVAGFYTAPGYSTEFLHLFRAEGLSLNGIQSEPDELINVKIIPVKNIPALLYSGKIVDGKTLIGLLILLKKL